MKNNFLFQQEVLYNPQRRQQLNAVMLSLKVYKRKSESVVAQTCPPLCDLQWTVAHQTPLSMKFSRQEWVVIPFSMVSKHISKSISLAAVWAMVQNFKELCRPTSTLLLKIQS